MANMSLAAVAEALRSFPVPVSPSTDEEFDVEIPMRDGHQSTVRIYTPPSSTGGRALFVLVHGGGFCFGHYSHIAHHARAISSAASVIVASVSYRVAPDFVFPTAANDVWDTLQWLKNADNASSLGVNLAQGLYIGGLSAGANLAAVTAQKWVSLAQRPPMAGVWLNMPFFFTQDTVPEKYKEIWTSREQNKSAMIIDGAAVDFIMASYAPNVRSPDFSPFNDEHPHAGMPPVYFQVCGQDPFRDDALVYERTLRDHGVSTRLDVYPGLPHGFAAVFDGLPATKKHDRDLLEGVAWLLSCNAAKQ